MKVTRSAYSVEVDYFCCEEMREAWRKTIHFDDDKNKVMASVMYDELVIKCCPFCGAHVDIYCIVQ